MSNRRHSAHLSRMTSVSTIHIPHSQINVQYNTVLQDETQNGVTRKLPVLTLSLSNYASLKTRISTPQPVSTTSEPAELSSPTESCAADALKSPGVYSAEAADLSVSSASRVVGMSNEPTESQVETCKGGQPN
ncbi:hypothetical protein E8E13_001198 [Curvularia kusanoi]|uniref:Uncharacterized protein n=1 Tax=Curvularia kusanoi TaxID=90978 RepID=A0A9P4W401_CURKU|nr:hypothetical protein E8E13_001198 [Curvularia kusanoi]